MTAQHPSTTSQPPFVELLAEAIRLSIASSNLATPSPSAPGPVRVSTKDTTTLTSVLGKLQELGHASPKELRLYLPASRATITRALRALERTGLIRGYGRTNGRCYTATPPTLVSSEGKA